MKIAELWAKRIIDGDRTYDEVPAKLKDAVAEALTEAGHPELITTTATKK